MNLPDLKTLDGIIKLCRKRGVESIEIAGVKIVLGDTPTKFKAKAITNDNSEIDAEGFGSMSVEDQLFWSSANPSSSLEDKASD